jgi:hypothetical protein
VALKAQASWLGELVLLFSDFGSFEAVFGAVGKGLRIDWDPGECGNLHVAAIEIVKG